MEKITQGDIHTNVETALANVVEKMDNTAIFEFTAENAQGQEVQPQGNLSVTFAIPAHLSENNLKMFYVSVAGEKAPTCWPMWWLTPRMEATCPRPETTA